MRKHGGPDGLVCVWFKRDAEVLFGSPRGRDTRARFFAGDIARQYMPPVWPGYAHR